MNENKITLCYYGNNFKYETENTAKLFFDVSGFAFAYKKEDFPKYGDYVIFAIKEGKQNLIFSVIINALGLKGRAIKFVDKTCKCQEDQKEYVLCRLFYDKMKELTGHHPAWGMITGIRPVAMKNKLKFKGMSEESQEKYFKLHYDISNEKYKLMKKCSDIQENILKNRLPHSCSLYISIPFCPSRCSYCSFVSSSISKAGGLIPEYFKLLLEELKITAESIRGFGYNLQCIYIGGGTPTTLSADQIRILSECIRENFDIEKVTEYCIEAGRADTITYEKCLAAYEGGMNRISVNPQTFSIPVLKKIGRRISPDENIKAFEYARKAGFEIINMDLIAGLPGDDLEGFKNSLERCIELSPENITVHALTLKRSADLFRGLRGSESLAPEKMINYSQKLLMNKGYNPYYLYRQKNTLDNLENTGYAKPGTEGVYNILIMDDSETIFGVGAAASTKLVSKNGKLCRIRNFKYPYEYVKSFDRIIEKKKKEVEELKNME